MKCVRIITVAPGVVKWAFFAATALTFLLAPMECKASVKIDLTVSTNRFVVDRTITWNLGTTGMRGWIDFGWPETPDQGGITDFAPYQILVTAVGTNTPAYGILATDDVILGASTGADAVPLFTRDARQSLGWALGDAEAATGILKLKRWRAGTTTDVSITLPVMGAYSATAPYNCAKTALVMTNAAKALAQRINTYGWGVDGPGSINAVALLSTGITNYLPMLQTFARQLAPTNMNAEASGGIGGWSFYDGIFLAEYYMLTGDAQVLHGLSEYVLYGARHMSMYGSGMSGVPPPEGWEKGGFHGSCPWYGPINNCTLVVQLTIALGRKAGITDPEMLPAIARASNFYSYFVGRGCIPYGEHAPYCGEQAIDGRTYWNHRSNGKDGLAAILFNVIGDRPVQAQYYSRMALAEYNGEWNGHTGQGFSYLWTELGANVGGTNAAKAYQQKMRWDRDMKRRLDGSFVYEGGEQMGAGYNVTDYWNGTQSYYDNATAYYLIHAAIPLQKLYITGKNPNPTNQLSVAAVSNALWSAQYPENCGGYTTNQLISHLAEYDPIVRMNAATELSLRPGASALIPQLIALAANPTNANQRAAACYTLGVMHTTNAVPTLVARLSDTDYWVRYRAAEALGPWNAGWQGSGIPVDATIAYLTSMMATYITNATPTYPLTYGAPTPGFNWDDPMQQANGMLGVTIFNPNNLGTYTINQPKNLLWPAVKAGIKHPSGDWLGNSMNDFVTGLLTLEDVKELAVDIFQLAELPPPLCAMYNESGPCMGKQVLSKYQITEGIDICMNYTGFWGWGPAEGYNSLWPYEEAARRKLPGLIDQKLAWSYTTDPVGGENYASYMRAIANIDAATNAPVQVYGRPYAAPQIAVTSVNTAKAITLVGTSCRTGLVTYAISAQPAHGALSGTAPNLTYTPAAGYQGMDSFTFTATDYVAASTPGTVHIVVGAGGTGVKGQYYDNVNFTTLMATVTNPAINFAWGTSAPTNTMAAMTYSVRWTGQVLAPESGLYRFSTRTSDGVRLWVNGKLVIDDWNDQPTNLWNDTVGITLTAGSKYNVKMEYYRNTTPATVRLYWYMPSRAECTIIPQELLYPETGVSLTSPTNGAGYASASTVTLTADVADMAGTVTNVAFYSGAVLLGNDTSAPYSFAWSAVPAGEYPLTARAAANNGTVSTSAVSVITVDGRTVPVSSGLVCWYDASYGVTVDRKQSVRAWEDRSGNGNNAVLHFNDGNPELMQNQLFTRPALRFNNYMGRCWLDVSRPMFVKEQYVIARNYTINPWNLGAFLGRSDTGSSSYLLSGTGFEWLPAGVSKNGSTLASPFNLAPTTDWMVLKITVDDSYTTPGPYMIGGSGGYYACKFDVAEIIGYSRTLTAQEEAAVGGYIESKYGVTTAYAGTGSLANQSASGLTESAATLNGTLLCNGTNYGVTAYWGTTDGGLTTNWEHSATVGSWNKVASTNFSLSVSGLLSGTTYYFTFRGTNTVSTGTIWAAPSQSFTTLSTNKDILAFGANVGQSSAVIDAGAATVVWTVPFGTDVNTLSPAYTVSPYATGNPVSGTSRNFTTPQTYTITAQNGSTKVYTVTVIVAPASSACDLLTFGPGAVIDGTSITWALPYGTDLTALAPAYTVSFGATGAPASGAAPSPNFAARNPATYTITAQDGITSKSYLVTITLLPYVPGGISNGSFEIGKEIPLNWNDGAGGWVNVDLSSGPSNTDLPGWFGNFYGRYDINNVEYCSAQDGERFVNLIGVTDSDVISQSFPVAAGKNYTVSYYERIRGNGFMDATVSVAAGTLTGANGSPVAVDAGPAASIVQTTAVNSDWTLHTFSFIPSATTTATLTFGNHYTAGVVGDNDGIYLDNVTLAVPPVPTLINAPATGVNADSAVLNTTLSCSGTNYSVYAHWNTVNGGTNATLWTNSAYIGSWTNAASTNLSYHVTGLVPGTTYYFTFRGVNASGNLWAPNVYTVSGSATPTQSQTITFEPLAAKTYGDAPFNPGATASSGLPVSYQSSDTSVATVSGSTVTILKAGSTVLTASQAGNGTYNAATNVLQTLTVNKRPVLLAGTRTYDGTAAAAAADLSITNNIDGANLTLSGSATLAGKNAGTQTVTAATGSSTPARVQHATGNTGASAATTLTVTLGATPANGNTLVAVISTRGTSADRVTGISGGVVTWSRASQAANASATTEIWYGPNVSGGTTAITITQASLISAAVVLEYNGLSAASPLDQVAGSAGTSTAAVTGTTPTTTQANELWIAGIGIADGRRTLNAPYGNAFTVVASPKSGAANTDAMIYALEIITNATGAASSGGTVSTSDSWAGAIATFKAATAASLTLGGSASTNYTLTGMSGTMAITPKALTLSGTTVTNKIYDATVTATLTNGLLLTAEEPGTGTPSDGKPYTGDAVGVTLGGTFDTKDVGVSKAVTSTSSLTLAQAGNYTLTQPVGLTATITPKALAVTGAAIASKPYDGTTNATFSGGALLAAEAPGAGSTADSTPYTGDALTLSLSGLFASKDKAVGIAVTSTSSLTGAQAGNYTLTQPVGLTGEITAVALTVTASAQSKTFGELLSFGSGSTLFSSSGLTNSETIGSVTLACDGGGGEAAVGTYLITPSAATGGTFTPGNYAITYTPGTLTVNLTGQTITFGALAAKTYGDAPFALTATASSLLDVSYESSDTSVATVSGSMVTILKAGATVITATQAGNASYGAATPVPQTLTINPATQTITFNALAEKTYGDAPFSLIATASSGLSVSYESSDTNVATVAGSTVNLLKAGNTTLTASQAGDANYNPASPMPQTLAVGKATPVLTWDAPATITIGTALSSNQLNAASGGVAGIFTYTPPAGTVLPVGAGQTLSVSFTPSDTGNYNAPADKQVALTVTAIILAEDFEHEWADNDLARTTNGWTSSGIAEQSSITNPASGYGPLAYGRTYPLVYNHSDSRRILKMNTQGDLLLTPTLNAGFAEATMYVDMMVKLVVCEGLPSDYVGLKAAVFFKADGATTNLYVFHGQKTEGGFGVPVFTPVTNGIAAEAWHRLTLVAAATSANGGAEAFRVLIDGQPLVSTNAYSDAWATRIAGNPYTPDNGTWFLSAARRAGTAGTNLTSIARVAFTGIGFVDDLVVTADEPTFSLGTVLFLAYGTTGEHSTEVSGFGVQGSVF